MNDSESIELSRFVKSTVNLHLSNEVYLKRISADIEEIIEEIEILQAREATNQLTGTVKQLEDDRDELVLVFETAVEAHRRAKKFKPDEGEAADRITAILESTKINIRAANAEETNQINTRLRALDTDLCRSDMDLLGVLDYHNELLAVEKSFEALSDKRSAIDTKRLRGTVRTGVQKLKKNLSYVFPYLESQYEQPENEYKVTADKVLEVVHTIMATAKARRTRKAGDTNN